MSKLQDSIVQELNILHGQPIKNIGRAGNMLWIGFGPKVEMTTFRGEKRMVNQFALHVQCAWRIINKNCIIVGFGDFFNPTIELNDEEYNNWNWDQQGNNMFDLKAAELRETFQNNSVKVEDIAVDQYGGFVMRFDNNYYLEVFPDGGGQHEFWRFFESATKKRHFVVFDEE